jgi:hypothetical protein
MSAFVYNDGSGKDDIKDNELPLNYGIFIDGTLNNKDNTDLRTEYARKNKDGSINKKLDNTTIEESDDAAYSKLKNHDLSKAADDREKYLIASHRYKLTEVVKAGADALDRMGTDNSFSNDYTNVARMWDCCKEEYRIYVAGMGTSDVETQGIGRDDGDGFQYGAGSLSGIRARTRLACEKLAEKVAKEIRNPTNAKKDKIEITVDVFGFSRGAATARNFVYEIKKGEYKPEPRVSYKEIKKSNSSNNNSNYPAAVQDNTRVKVKDVYMSEVVGYLDQDGQKVEKYIVINEKMPKMGHFGHALLQQKILKKDFEKLKIIVRFVGIYDTVSSYEEWGAMGGDSVVKKGIKHLQKSLFKDDVQQLGLNSMGYIQKIVHFTAKDEHRENFDLTRVQGANMEDHQGNVRVVEKNFPGVHCDIGGAYINEKEIIDEVEVVNKIGGGFKNPSEQPDISFKLLQDYKDKLIKEYWYKDKELTIYPTGIDRYYKLTGIRDMKKEYSYIPLLFMNDYCNEYMKENMIENKIEKDYVLENKLLRSAKNHLEPYVMNKGGKEWNFISDDVFARKQRIEKALEKKKQQLEQEKEKKRPSFYVPDPNVNIAHNTKVVINKAVQKEILVLPADQIVLRTLRHEYFHWSANRDWLGMDPNENRKRVEH